MAAKSTSVNTPSSDLSTAPQPTSAKAIADSAPPESSDSASLPSNGFSDESFSATPSQKGKPAFPIAIRLEQEVTSPTELTQFELTNDSDEWEEVEEPESYFDGEFLGRCKSWMTSMVLHLIVIIGLALLTTKGGGRSLVMLEMSGDDNGSMMELEDLEFAPDSGDWEEPEEPEALNSNASESQELQDHLEMLDDLQIDSADLSDLVNGDATNISGASRDASEEILRLSGGSSSFFGIKATGNSIVFIVDRSGSMQGERWINATRELVKVIESLKPEQRFQVYLFSSSCHPMPRMRGTKNNEMPLATKTNIGRFKKWLFRQQPGGSTMPLSAVKRAIRQEPDTMFLLTDGQIYDNTGEYLLQHARNQITRSDPDDLIVNTIAFHCQVGLEMLMDIATVYEGTFRSVE